MTAHHRFRKVIAVAAGAFIASTALTAAVVAPADAGVPKHKHELSIYKAEQYIKLDTHDLTEATVSCFNNDTAIDGMWMLRSVDKAPVGGDPDEDPDFPSTGGGAYNDLRDVSVLASYPDPNDTRKWNFKFQDRAYGDAQLSIYVLCISDYTSDTNGHHHQIKVTPLPVVTTGVTVDHPGFGDPRSYYEYPTSCQDDQYFVAPGFDVSGIDPDHRLVGSYASDNGKSWIWEFGALAGSHPVFYGKCIDRRVVSEGNHRHTIAMKQMPRGPSGVWGYTSVHGNLQTIHSGEDWRDVTYTCDQDNPSYHGYKAGVGMFWIGSHWQHTWFYGMEPRPKTRSFRFFSDVDSDVRIGALCINTRTSNPN